MIVAFLVSSLIFLCRMMVNNVLSPIDGSEFVECVTLKEFYV